MSDLQAPSAAEALAPDSVWTRQRPAWRIGVRAALGSLGIYILPLAITPVRYGSMSWLQAIALDVGLAAVTGVCVALWTAVRRAGLAAFLESRMVLPWIGGALLLSGTGFVAGALLRVPGPWVLAAGIVPALAWTIASAAAWILRYRRAPRPCES